MHKNSESEIDWPKNIFSGSGTLTSSRQPFNFKPPSLPSSPLLQSITSLNARDWRPLRTKFKWNQKLFHSFHWSLSSLLKVCVSRGAEACCDSTSIKIKFPSNREASNKFHVSKFKIYRHPFHFSPCFGTAQCLRSYQPTHRLGKC